EFALADEKFADGIAVAQAALADHQQNGGIHRKKNQVNQGFVHRGRFLSAKDWQHKAIFLFILPQITAFWKESLCFATQKNTGTLKTRVPVFIFAAMARHRQKLLRQFRKQEQLRPHSLR
ncbi:MAG: hypothetical protein ACLSWV_12110, partial [Pygmaiobacter massiliensis]